MGINCKPQLSPTVYTSLQSFVEFKADFHHIFIRARKDPMKTWHRLPYLAINDVIFAFLKSWLLEWCAETSSVMEVDKSIVKRQKEETKLRIEQLAKKRRKEEVEAKTQAARDATKLVE